MFSEHATALVAGYGMPQCIMGAPFMCQMSCSCSAPHALQHAGP